MLGLPTGICSTEFKIINNNGDSEVQQCSSLMHIQDWTAAYLFVWIYFSFNRDIKKVKDSQKDFEKASSELDNAINRNASIPRTKTQECEEAATMLKAKKSCFAHTSVDHVFQVSWSFWKFYLMRSNKNLIFTW